MVRRPGREPLDRNGHQGGPEGGRVAHPLKAFTSAGGGLYRHNPTSSWYERPWVDGKRTWRKLQALTPKQAREEIALKRADQARSRLGLAINPYAGGQTIAAILDAYERAGFPDKHRQGRSEKARAEEQRRTGSLRRIIGEEPIASLSAPVCDRYADFRRAELKAIGRDGSRAVDLEIQALSNALNYAQRTGMAIANPIRHGRPRYHRASRARHARDCSPASGNELHLLARTLAEDPRGEVLAWQLLFSALTGCRTSEILRLRTDAAPRKPGFIEGDWLWIERSKNGVNPFVVIHPDLRACIEGHRKWLAALPEKWRGPWWFPSRRVPGQPTETTSLSHALYRVAPALGLGDRTAHGLRAYFVTVRRSQGISDGQIAAEIGDKTSSLIATTYGQVPPGWRGGPELCWIPTDGNPAFWEAA